MTIRKSLTFVMLLVFALSLCLFTVNVSVTHASDKTESAWTPSGYTLDDDGVYTSTNVGESTIAYKNSLENINTVSAKFLYKNNPTDGGGAYMGFQVFYDDSMFFIARMYLNCGQYYNDEGTKPFFRAQKLLGGIGYKTLGESPRLNRADGFGKDTWIDVKLTLVDDILVMYVNGEKYVEATGFGSVTWNKLNIISSFDVVQVKDISVGFEQPVLSEWSIDASWKTTTEGDETVYSTTAENSSVIWYLGNDVGDYNTIEADIQYSEPRRGDAGINLQVNHTGEGGTYILNIAPNCNPLNPVARLFNKNSTNVSPVSRVEISSGYGDTSANTWVHVKFIVDENAIVCYVNGRAVYKQLSPETGRKWVKAGVNTFVCPAKVKNIQLSKSTIDYKEFGYTDLEFSSKAGVDCMTVYSGAAEYDSGMMVAGATGEGFAIESPVIEENPGHKYSMYMPVRNTFLVRMNNETSATKVKLSFRTSTSGDEYKYTKEFDVLSNGGWQTYYFNVSGLNATGYLRQFKMEFVGATEGNVYIDAITFEREEKIYDYAGSIDSCIADKTAKTVTVKGTTKEGYDGKNVIIWQSSPKNYNDSLNYSGLKKLATVKVSGNKFEATFPLYKENSAQTQLSSYFLASIDGVKVDTHFVIENYQDFNDDPERFKVDIKLVADVTEYGAKGDGFTDDTAAFQAAIDAVEKAGGGKVVIPGDDSVYGRRYILTHIELCSNIEFVIEKGAVLWQSQREEELNKTVPVRQRGFDKVTYGQSVDIDGLVWCTGLSTVNLPMILVRNKENVRITGYGTIRMNDVGGEMEDPFYFVGDSGLAKGQENRVHQIPICLYSNKHVAVTDITMMRSNGWHLYMSFNNDVYIGNIKEKQTVNVTGDGFTVTSCKNLTIDRCFTYTSDDAVGICTAYEDGRGQFYRPTKPEEDNATENITIRHSFLFGGFGISWMPWGAAASNMYKQETRNVLIEDCSLGGHKSSGTWPDDPFYGWSATSHYTQTEDNNYCPIKNVTFKNNEYLGAFDLTLNNIQLKATNFLVWDDIEGTIYSSSEMLNGDFDKQVHKGEGFKDETDYITGLSYWSSTGNVGFEKVGTKQAYTVDTKELITQNDYAGYIDGEGTLYQGVYKLFGNYSFNLKVKLVSGSAKLFVRDAFTGVVYAEKLIDSTSEEFVTYTLPFGLVKSSTIQVGIENLGTVGNKVYIDDACVNEDEDENRYLIEGEEYNYDFEEDYKEFTTYTTSAAKAEIKDGKLVFDNTGEVKYMWNNVKDLTTIDVTMKVAVKSEMNIGLYLFATNVSPEADNINAYNVQIERDSSKSSVTLYRFTNKYDGSLASKAVEFTGEEFTLRVLVKQSTIFAFVNGEKEPLFAYEAPEGKTGNIGIRSQYRASEINSLKIVSSEAKLAAGDSSRLNTLIETAKTYKEYDYTEATYGALKTALENAEAAKEQTQYKIDKAYEDLYNALMGLERMPAGDKTQLNALIATVKGVDQSKYTAESYEAMKAALKAAEDLDEDATQGAIDAAYKALDDAYKALEEKQIEPDTDSSTDSGTTTDSGSSDSGNKGGKKGCKGGIASGNVMLLTLGLVAVYAIVKKRRINE